MWPSRRRILVPLATPTKTVTNCRYLAAAKLTCFAKERLKKPSADTPKNFEIT